MNATTAVTRRAELYAEHAKGPATRWHGPKSRAAGRRGETWTADEVAGLIPEGGAVALYVSFGHVNGREGFGREVLVRDGDRVTVLRPGGTGLLAYPLGQGRTLRLLVS